MKCRRGRCQPDHVRVALPDQSGPARPLPRTPIVENADNDCGVLKATSDTPRLPVHEALWVSAALRRKPIHQLLLAPIMGPKGSHRSPLNFII
jgi:hypothetical protein